MTLNNMTIAGNLTADPQINETHTGVAVCNVTIATNEYYTKNDGSKGENVNFIDVSLFDKQAQTASKYLKKGSPILVQGNIKSEQWENENGEKRSRIRVRGARFQFLPTSANLNTGSIIGNVTRDPEIKTFDNGKVASMGIAINETYLNSDGEKTSVAQFIECEAWGKNADNIEQFIGKGDLLLLSGSLKSETWKNEQDETRSRTKFRVAQVQFLKTRNRPNATPATDEVPPEVVETPPPTTTAEATAEDVPL